MTPPWSMWLQLSDIQNEGLERDEYSTSLLSYSSVFGGSELFCVVILSIAESTLFGAYNLKKHLTDFIP